jgi:hypothetical protein
MVWDYFAPTAEEESVIAAAAYAFTRDCMANQGFVLVDPPPQAVPREVPPSAYDIEIGILDHDYAAAHGYQLAANGDVSSPTPVEETSREYENALKEPGGCADQTFEAINAGIADDESSGLLAADIDESSIVVTWNDREVVASLGIWRRCMEQAGFEYDSPKAAYEAFTGFSVTGDNRIPGMVEARTDEIETALRDVECKEAGGIEEIWKRVLWRERYRSIQENLPALQALSEEVDRKVSNAERILAAAGEGENQL